MVYPYSMSQKTYCATLRIWRKDEYSCVFPQYLCLQNWLDVGVLGRNSPAGCRTGLWAIVPVYCYYDSYVWNCDCGESAKDPTGVKPLMEGTRERESSAKQRRNGVVGE